MLNEDMNLVYYDLKDIMASRSLKSGFVNCHCSPGLLLTLGGILRYVNESNIAIGCICVLKWHFRKFQSTWFMIHGRNDFFLNSCQMRYFMKCDLNTVHILIISLMLQISQSQQTLWEAQF